jgi:predicted secreted protein
MASAAIRGDTITLSIGGDLIGESRDFSLAFDVGDIDITSRDSSRTAEFLVGRYGWTISGNALYITSDVAKKVMLNQITAASPTTFTIILTIGSQTFTGSAVVTSFTINAPYESAADYSFTLKGSGALTISAS